MVLSTKIAAIVTCALLVGVVLELVRKKKVREEYSLLWLGVTLVFAVLVIFDSLTLRVIHHLGGTNISSLFFFGGVLFAILMLLHMTVCVSELKRKQSVLIQELALLRQQVEVLDVTQSGPGDGEGVNS